MARARKPIESSLEIAVREIGENLAKLTTRLVGDEKMQTKGLIHEVAETRSDSERQFASILADQKATTEALRILVAEMRAVQEFKDRQLAINKEVEEFRVAIEKDRNVIQGSWKTLSILVAGATSFGGAAVWIATKLLHP